MKMRVGLIGAKLQGQRRAPAIQSFPDTELVVVSAAHKESAQTLASKFGCEAAVGWEHVVNRNDLDIVVICTPPHLHAQISIAAMERGKHVLCEKPLARTVREAEAMVKVAKANNVVLKCGFNHRYHPAIQKAKELLDKGMIGKPYFIRCRYGICGRLGYEREWRANPEIAAGGQLMEQGIHAVDLSRWFLGEFREVVAFTANYFWKTEPLEDNAFVLLRSEDGKVAFIHSSLTQWKNLFSFEIFGSEGYAIVDGLGGSYGTERLIFGRREFLKPFAEEVTEFRGEDRSWYEEWKDFIACIKENREPLGSGYDGLIAMRLVNAAYESSQKRCVVTL
jgi:predicted dehydrogenase